MKYVYMFMFMHCFRFMSYNPFHALYVYSYMSVKVRSGRGYIYFDGTKQRLTNLT